MGRIQSGLIKLEMASATGLAFLAISIFMSIQAPAQEAAQQPKPAAKSAKAAHNIWKPVASGVWEAYIPRFDDKGEDVKPEFAVIRLTAAKYQEFEQGGKDFLNNNKVFSQKINQLESCPSLTPQTQPPKVTFYYLVVPHWPGSTAFCTAYTGWSPPKE